MRKTELQRFRKLLLAEKERVVKSMAHHEKVIRGQDGEGGGSARGHSNHLADQGTDEYEYEATIHTANAEGRYLYHIEEALARIEDGSYGKCERCEQKIGMERLKALPHARLCIECKEKEEEGSA